MFAEMSRGIPAQHQAQNRDAHTAEQPLQLRMRERKRGDANRVPHTDAPSNPKIRS
jgi:hypothetical protein